jgi:hypothetical protein
MLGLIESTIKKTKNNETFENHTTRTKFKVSKFMVVANKMMARAERLPMNDWFRTAPEMAENERNRVINTKELGILMDFPEDRFDAKQRNPKVIHISVEIAFASDVPNKVPLMSLGSIEAKISSMGDKTRRKMRKASFLVIEV